MGVLERAGADASCRACHVFEANMIETKTMLPVIKVSMTAPRLPDITAAANIVEGMARD